jgi:L-arabinose isomerase
VSRKARLAPASGKKTKGNPTAITAAFGCHVVLCEPDEILKFYLQEDKAAVEAKKKVILDFFDTPDPVSDPLTTKLTQRDLDVAAKAAIALDKFTADRNLDGLAYYYEALPATPIELPASVR